MTLVNTIIRHPRGALRREVPLEAIQVPDVWHLAMKLKEDPHYGPDCAKQILEVWSLAHDLLLNLHEDTAPF